MTVPVQLALENYLALAAIAGEAETRAAAMKAASLNCIVTAWGPADLLLVVMYFGSQRTSVKIG